MEEGQLGKGTLEERREGDREALDEETKTEAEQMMKA